MILAYPESVGVAPDGVTERFLIQVYDSTRSPHGNTDTRWNADGSTHDHGVGTGYLYVDTNAATGEDLAHTWSTALGGTSYTQALRPMVVGRFVR